MSNKEYKKFEVFLTFLLTCSVIWISTDQYLNYKKNHNAKLTSSVLKYIRQEIADKIIFAKIKCNVAYNYKLPANDVVRNSIVEVNDGLNCTEDEVVDIEDRLIMEDGYPHNPSDSIKIKSTIHKCLSLPANCKKNGCNNIDFSQGGWCYSDLSGEVWSNAEGTTMY